MLDFKIFIVLVIMMMLPTHRFYLNYILKETDKGKIWRKDISVADKRAAAIALSQTACLLSFVVVAYIYILIFGN